MPATRSSARAPHLGPQRRRPLVLDAALGVFARRGYAEASMDVIAAAAGVSKPVLYDCYADKAELYAALLDREQRRLLAATLASVPGQPDPSDAEGALVGGFTALFEAVAASPDSWRVVFAADRAGETAAVARTRAARALVIERLAEAIEVVLASRAVADARRRASLLASLTFGMADAGVRMLLAGEDDWGPAELGAEIGRIAAAGGLA